jgi:cyanophycinase
VLLLPILALAALPQTCLASDKNKSRHTGTLVLCGGGKLPDVVRDRFLHLAGGERAQVVVIPTASKRADTPEVEVSLSWWKGSRVKSVELLHTRSRKQANDEGFLKPLSQATGVWLGGGDQNLLAAAYGDTAFVRELQQVLARGGVVGGTSAGAAIMSHVMIAGGTQEPLLGKGFGLVTWSIVDQHFAQRKREARLLAALNKNPGLCGLGVDEETAAFLSGDVLEVIGASRVAVYNRAEGRPNNPFECQVFPGGTRYNLKTRKRLVAD